MVLYNGTNPVVVGNATAKGDIGRAINNTFALHDDYGPRQVTRGMRLRTHPDPGFAAFDVLMLGADEIVFDDGFREFNLAPLIANMTVSGAQGLDTGSEAASTWYEIYCIRKSSDGTKALLLHRAKDYFLDETYLTPEDSSFQLRRATGTLNTDLAQGFKVDTAGPVAFADIKLFRAGAVAAASRAWLTIEADASGSPSGTPLATADAFDASLIAATTQLIRFPFRTPAALVAAAQHHLRLKGDYTPSDTVNISWGADLTGATYANGSQATWNGTTWTPDTNTDLMFRVYVTRNDTAVVMPSGYDQKCLLGWVYNDSVGAGNFVPFCAFDRVVSPLVTQSLGTIVAVIPTLTDLSAFVPPVPVALSVAVQNATAAAGAAVAPVPDGFGTSVGGVRIAGGVRFVQPSGSGGVKIELAPILTEFQGCYLMTDAGSLIANVGMWRW